jgi:hypothetical protein
VCLRILRDRQFWSDTFCGYVHRLTVAKQHVYLARISGKNISYAVLAIHVDSTNMPSMSIRGLLQGNTSYCTAKRAIATLCYISRHVQSVVLLRVTGGCDLEA